MNKTYRILITAIVSVLITSGATGQTTLPAGDKSPEAERVQLIRTMLDDTRISNSIWWYGWMGVYGGLTAGSFAAAYISDNDVTKITQAVSGVESVIGLAGLLLSPMPPAYAACSLDRMPFSTTEEKKAKLAASEGYLRDTAETQEFGRSWINQCLNLAVNAAGGLVIWKGYEDRIERAGGNPRKEGLLNFIIGMAVSEIQIFTQPTAGIDQWKSYKEKYNTGYNEFGRDVIICAVPNGTGVSVGLTLFY